MNLPGATPTAAPSSPAPRGDAPPAENDAASRGSDSFGPSTRPRVAALDGLRAIAVLLVVALHYYVIVPGPDSSSLHVTLQRLGSLGFAGVDLFFVLSGFFIGGILLDFKSSPRLLPAFYARRFFRIVPLYFVLLASFLVCREVPGFATINRGTYFTSPVPVWSYFVFAQNIAMAAVRDIGPYWLGATWSLAVEEQFYLLMPLVVLRLSRGQLIAACLAGIAVCPLVRIVALTHAQNNLAAVFLLPARADGLLWGVLCALALRSAPALAWMRRRRGALAVFIAALAVVFGWASWRGFSSDSREMVTVGYSLISVFFAALVLHVAAFPESRAARVLAMRPLAAIGLGSYFIYLFHTPVWYFLHWALLGKPPLHLSWTAGGVTLLAFVATLALAALSWRWLESPLLRYARTKFRYA